MIPGSKSEGVNALGQGKISLLFNDWDSFLIRTLRTFTEHASDLSFLRTESQNLYPLTPRVAFWGQSSKTYGLPYIGCTSHFCKAEKQRGNRLMEWVAASPLRVYLLQLQLKFRRCLVGLKKLSNILTGWFIKLKKEEEITYTKRTLGKFKSFSDTAPEKNDKSKTKIDHIKGKNIRSTSGFSTITLNGKIKRGNQYTETAVRKAVYTII